jgi:hypothetical protein
VPSKGTENFIRKLENPHKILLFVFLYSESNVIDLGVILKMGEYSFITWLSVISACAWTIATQNSNLTIQRLRST